MLSFPPTSSPVKWVTLQIPRFQLFCFLCFFCRHVHLQLQGVLCTDLHHVNFKGRKECVQLFLTFVNRGECILSYGFWGVCLWKTNERDNQLVGTCSSSSNSIPKSSWTLLFRKSQNTHPKLVVLWLICFSVSLAQWPQVARRSS